MYMVAATPSSVQHSEGGAHKHVCIYIVKIICDLL